MGTLGTIVATQEGPNPTRFHFVISEETARIASESGTFVQVKQDFGLVLGVIETLKRSNRYFSSPDIIHGSSQGISLPEVFPSERWDYLIASVKVLGCYKENIHYRSTRPVLPGSVVQLVDKSVLSKFLGLSDDGLALGKLRQSNLDMKISLDRLLKKHLAVLSISGGGKSYAISVIIEELLKRRTSDGRPGLVIFDVHGEYTKLKELTKHPDFKDVSVKIVGSRQISMALGNLDTSDFAKFFPTMSYAQQRELNRILAQYKFNESPLSIEKIISTIYDTEMNSLVKDALLGWMSLLKNIKLFGNAEYPIINEVITPGQILVIDLSDFTSLWKKRVVVHYFLSRIFSLRRQKLIPPVVSIIEEAHQFAPEVENAASKHIIHTIAREGRKFLCSIVLVSQRPVNLSTTALSQCNSHLILRILNPHDLNYIGKTSEGISHETLGMLTTLGVGEALLTGEAVNYPVFLQIREKIALSDFDETSLSKESQRYEKLVILSKNQGD
ncbi:MAG: ATP-binding protein [Candidatus Kariarchaeaceae archaeon]